MHTRQSQVRRSDGQPTAGCPRHHRQRNLAACSATRNLITSLAEQKNRLVAPSRRRPASSGHGGEPRRDSAKAADSFFVLRRWGRAGAALRRMGESPSGLLDALGAEQHHPPTTVRV
jgi:hypothetical protein